VDAPDQFQPQPDAEAPAGPAPAAEGPRRPSAPAPASSPEDPFGPPSIQVEAVIPPVVAVVVAHDPGDWFEDCLRSVGAQTYANTSVLVVDGASLIDLTPRVAAVLPHAHVRRLDANVGFGPAANAVLTAVEGAAFYLFCHDDVRLEPDVVQVMVEEAFRSNAGVVGGKLVEWDDPQRILQVGMAADKTGAPAPYVERGELDQEQHDSVRDVFYVPGGATLVRADLFEALDGFDPDIELLGEDLDLSWRAHVVGARVLVAPSARIGHLEAYGHRCPVEDRRRLQMRHRLRTSRVCYTRFSRVRVMPQAAFLAFVEFLFGVVTGRFRHAADVLSAWVWNGRHRRSTRARRRLLAAHRAVPDRDVRRLQVRGSARLSAFLRGQLGTGEDRLGSVTGAGRDLVTNLRSASLRSSLLAWFAVVVLFAFGSREILTTGLPAIGQFTAFPSHPSNLIQQWSSGFRSTGLGSETAAPTLLAVVGALGYVFFGAMSLLRTVLIIGALPLGAVGIWRLARPLGSRRARITALVVYACLPVAINAVARGRWDGLAMYAFAPWMANQLARGSRLAPFGPVTGDVGPGVTERSVVQRIALLGLVTAVAALVVPFAAVALVAMALCFAVGSLLVGQLKGSARVLLVGVAGALVAVVLQLPWSLSVVKAGWPAVVGLSTTGGEPLTLTSVLRFDTGPFGSAPFGWMFLGAGVLVLLIGRHWRLEWAVRFWVMIVAGMAAAFVAAGRPAGWFPAPEVLLAPAATGLAMVCALGMAAFEVDLPDYHFGWRQIASVLAGAALLLGVFPIIGASLSGQWGLPTSDFSPPLSNLSAKDGNTGPYRILWLGEAALVPGAPWKLSARPIDELGSGRALAYATSDNGMPDVSDLHPGSDSGATAHLADTLKIAAAGDTTRLGALLAPMGVRYIVVPLANAPSPFNTGPVSQPTRLLSMLNDQLDLADVDVIEGIAVFRNAAWGPTRAQLPAGTPFPSGGPSIASRIVPSLNGAPTALASQSAFQSFSGSLSRPSTIYLSEAASARWRLTVNGRGVPGREVLGWSNAFSVPSGSHATLEFDTPFGRWAELAGQAALWLIVLGLLLRARVRSQAVRDRDVLEAEGELA
jgi:GT2 family glycosyltransferase